MQVSTEMRAIARPAPSSFPVATDFYAREVSGLPAELRRQVRIPLAWAALSRLMQTG